MSREGVLVVVVVVVVVVPHAFVCIFILLSPPKGTLACANFAQTKKKATHAFCISPPSSLSLSLSLTSRAAPLSRELLGERERRKFRRRKSSLNEEEREKRRARNKSVV